MTTLATSHTLSISDEQSRQADKLLRFVSQAAPLRVVSAENRTATVPPELRQTLAAVIAAVSRGETITLRVMPEELTTTMAANELGVSRPTLMKLIREGAIAAFKVGSHHRLKASDVRDFAAKRHAERATAFEDLRRLEDEFGIED